MTTPSEPHADRVVVDVWSDVMCPWCYVGATVLDRAIEDFDHPVEVRHHSFLLVPDLPDGRTMPVTEVLTEYEGFSLEQAAAMNRQIDARAAGLGLDRDAALAALRSDAHVEDVDADVEMARQIGITGVPFFVLNGKYAVQGAQPVEAFRHALATAWADHEGAAGG
ncbi:DsbA family protein [Kytococcus schroeteri]|uniref:DsbA family oxidoreductase n=1 Tax=Kytococcus schroeteri TaxID=138300 RepID=UPI0011450F5F|nr:DsbA family protein [Kytococcus schroeteri]